MNKFELYRRAINKWGIMLQEDILIEELSELIKEIIKYRRKGADYNLEDLFEEIIDVENMVEQIKAYYVEASDEYSEKLAEIKQKKLNRLEKLIIES